MSVRRSSPVRGNERFVARRRAQRRRWFVFTSVMVALLCVGSIYLLNQEFLRISRVDVIGSEPLSVNEQTLLTTLATEAMQGSYLGIIPHNSILLYAGRRIRDAILAADSDIAAVSLFRSGLTGLTVRVSTRVPVTAWCGSALSGVPTLTGSSTESLPKTDECYYFDASGVLYATTTAQQSINSFLFYEDPGVSSDAIAFGMTLPHASTFPSAFDFARQLKSFGSPVTAVVYRDEEIDDYLASGTRITYVRGHEQDAFTALTSARDRLNLADGSIEYVDLRFKGKVYVKRRTGGAEQ